MAREIGPVLEKAQDRRLRADAYSLLGETCERVFRQPDAPRWCRPWMTKTHPALLYYYHSYRERGLERTALAFERLWLAELARELEGGGREDLGETTRAAVVAGRLPEPAKRDNSTVVSNAILWAGHTEGDPFSPNPDQSTILVVLDRDRVSTRTPHVYVAVSRGEGLREPGRELARIGHRGLFATTVESMAHGGSQLFAYHDETRESGPAIRTASQAYYWH